MDIKKYYILTVLFLSCHASAIIAQYSEIDFTSPIKHELRLAGTFGELRSNHFHMGLDIKSARGVSGDPIFTVGEGFVSRILVSRTGYGNAIYVDHPNGYTSVYGHLSKFNKEISALVHAEQIKEQSFEIDINLDSSQLLLSAGSELAKMGNSGSSSGPHLHFELRHTKSEVPINPMNFGISPVDRVSPIIKRIKIFHLDDKNSEVSANIFDCKKNQNDQYVLESDTISIAAWRIGIGAMAIDPMNQNSNKNGIYSMKMLLDGIEVYKFSFDSISFPDSKYINAHIDYPHFKNQKQRIHRCYKLPGNKLPFVRSTDNSIIPLYRDKTQEVILEISDYSGNRSTVRFHIRRDEEMSPPPSKLYNYLLPHQESSIIQLGKLKLFLPEEALYEDLKLYLNRSEEKSKDILSDIYYVGTKETPLHKAATIFIRTDNYNPLLRDKLCIVNCENTNAKKSFGGHYSQNYVSAEITEFGIYAIGIDTIAPTIVPRFSTNDLTTASTISFRIDDNMDSAGNAKGLSYRATIDGEWVLFNYDLKSKVIRHKFETPPDGNEHLLKLAVTDDRGNTSVFEKKLKR